MFWLNIIAATGKSVEEITRAHWEKYGRSYYLRFDFDGIPTDVAGQLMKDLEAKLPSLNGQKIGSYEVSKAESFVYNDPVDHSSTANGLRILFRTAPRSFTAYPEPPAAARPFAFTLRNSAATIWLTNRARWWTNC